MLHIYNSHTHVNKEIKDNKETFSFEINIKNYYRNSKKYEAVVKLNWFSHNIGNFTSVKKAEQAVTDYYEKEYEMLIQLKKLGSFRTEIGKKIMNSEITLEELHELIDSSLNENIYNLVGSDRIRVTRYELYHCFKKASTAS